MSIYDVKLYGMFFRRLTGGAKVSLFEEPVKEPTRDPYAHRFEATVLKQYGTKQDVLCLQFANGRSEYITLYEPIMYLNDGEWQPAQHKEVVEAFWVKHNEMKEIEALGNNTSIFDFTFYGVQEEFGFGIKKVEVSLSRACRDRCLAANGLLFTATILKEYKANKYVIKAVTDEGEICYIPLFNANMYYDEERRKWDNCNESPIPAEILKCYIKHLND